MLRCPRLLHTARLSVRARPLPIETHREEPYKCWDHRMVRFIEQVSPHGAKSVVPSIYDGSNDPKINGKILLKLSKIRLTCFVVMTQLVGHLVACSSVDPATLVCASLGTGLTSSSAATLNQILEIPFDSQMSRTKDRVLVRSAIAPENACLFSLLSGSAGLLLLWGCVSWVTSLLAFANIILYSFIYTPMKRYSVANTWVGSFVGAIPPIIGWHSATGCFGPGCFVLAGLLYCWQIPHFNSLSWNYREEYSLAGYRLTSFLYPGSCRGASLRHSVYLSLLCLGAPFMGCGNVYFSVISSPLNLLLIYACFKFYKEPTRETSRKLFFFSLIHLPLLLLVLTLTKFLHDGLLN